MREDLQHTFRDSLKTLESLTSIIILKAYKLCNARFCAFFYVHALQSHQRPYDKKDPNFVGAVDESWQEICPGRKTHSEHPSPLSRALQLIADLWARRSSAGNYLILELQLMRRLTEHPVGPSWRTVNSGWWTATRRESLGIPSCIVLRHEQHGDE